MSRSKIININGREYELYFSTWAMRKMSEAIGGDISYVGEWLNTGDVCESLERYGQIIAILINGGIAKHNADVDFGLCEGDKKPFISAEYINCVLNAGDLLMYKDEIFAAMNMGTEFTVPDGVEIAEKDYDLMEIEREKNP